MWNKIKRYKLLIIMILVIGASSLLGGLLGAKLLNNQGKIEKVFRNVSLIISLIEDNYGEEIKTQEIIEAGINGMLDSLDPHSNFLNEKSYSQMKEEQHGSFYGLGITLSKINGMLTVISPIEGTPAYKAGIRAGDIISEINGVPTKDEPIDVSVVKLRGPKGSQVSITVLREGYNEPLHFTLTRDEIPINSIPYSFIIDDDTGYIKIKSFTETTESELNNALEKLTKQGMKKLILDLRGNAGGLLEEAIKVADKFLPKSTLVTYTKGRTFDSNQEYYCEDTDEWENLPLIILVNRGTASASEIVSAAIQDHDRGLIIGTNTWGKGLVQSLYPLKYNTALALTTAKYYTPSGRLIQRNYESFYDYYFTYENPEEEKEKPSNQNSEIYYTDSGRKVYGGGGIQPDITIEGPKYSKLMDQLLRKYVFFNFAKKYESYEKGNYSSNLIKLNRDFKVDDNMLNNFIQFIKSEKIEFTEEEFVKDKDIICAEIAKEIRLALWGAEEAYKYYLKEDEAVKNALIHFNDAISLFKNKKLGELKKE